MNKIVTTLPDPHYHHFRFGFHHHNRRQRPLRSSPLPRLAFVVNATYNAPSGSAWFWDNNVGGIDMGMDLPTHTVLMRNPTR